MAEIPIVPPTKITTVGSRYAEEKYRNSGNVSVSASMLRFSKGMNFFHANGDFIGSLTNYRMSKLLYDGQYSFQIIDQSKLSDYLLTDD